MSKCTCPSKECEIHGTPPDPQHGHEQEWICPRCGRKNAANNEACMGAEMGDGQCGKPKPDKVKPDMVKCIDCLNGGMGMRCAVCGTSPSTDNPIDCTDFESKHLCDCSSCVKLRTPKPLVQYLGEYIDHELCNNTEHDSWRELLEQALNAYQSTEQVKIRIERV